MTTCFRIFVLLLTLASCLACKCYVSYEQSFGSAVKPVVKSRRPSDYLKEADLPAEFDWRNVNNTNFCSRVLTQESPNVCGSCWAEAAMGALTDRYNIATANRLNVQLSVQQLLNFNAKNSGGSCNGGDHLQAYDFVHRYGVSDDTCAPFVGLNWLRGFEVAAMTDVEEVQAHQCYKCHWNGVCGFVHREKYHLYGADEFGTVAGETEMKAEIFSRGPIACLLNSDVTSFDQYRGGIIACDPLHDGKHCQRSNVTDHVVVIAGWGVENGVKYWSGRNSYGTQWGEGAGGGWFRLRRAEDDLNLEGSPCSFAVPAAADVMRAVKQFESALGSHQ